MQRLPQAHAGRADLHRLVLRRHLDDRPRGRGDREPADAARYRELAGDIRRAFNERFFDEATASYAAGSQTSRAMPLWFGLVPAEHRDRALAGLVEEIGRDGGHLSTGTMGTAALQHVLTGEPADVMYGIATRTTFPSWGDQVARGATTVWETWGGDPTFSRNMKLLAMIGTFLYNDVAGLTPAAPGWRRILVRPSLTHRLAHAGARVRTVRGTRRSTGGRARTGST